MAYAFDPAEAPVAGAVRRIARERVDASLALFDDADVAEAKRIHELRKNIKKLRGLVRLVRPVFPSDAAENDAMGVAGRRIGHLRDADVREAGLAALARRARLPKADRAALAAAFGAGLSRPDPAEAEAALLDHLAALRDLRLRIEDWRIEAEGFAAFAPGLERVLLRGRRAMKEARKHPEGEAVHTWRKRVKDHWYHARLLTPVWPALMKPWATAVGELGELLGEARDLALLAQALEPLAEAKLPGAARLAARARQDEAALMQRADRLGRMLFVEDPQTLAARWAGWWRIAKR